MEYSLLEIADAIEEISNNKARLLIGSGSVATCISSDTREIVQRIEQQMEQEQMSSSARRSRSDIGTSDSKDSSEIPFDERSSEISSPCQSSNQGKSSLFVEGRDDYERKQSRESESDARSDPSEPLTVPYIGDTRAQLMQPSGSYMYLKLKNDHSPMRSPTFARKLSIYDSSSSGSTESLEREVKMAKKSLQLPDIRKASSTDSDDTIDKLREYAESSIDDEFSNAAKSPTTTIGAQSPVISVATTEITEKTKNTITPKNSLEEFGSSSSSDASSIEDNSLKLALSTSRIHSGYLSPPPIVSSMHAMKHGGFKRGDQGKSPTGRGRDYQLELRADSAAFVHSTKVEKLGREGQLPSLRPRTYSGYNSDTEALKSDNPGSRTPQHANQMQRVVSPQQIPPGVERKANVAQNIQANYHIKDLQQSKQKQPTVRGRNGAETNSFAEANNVRSCQQDDEQDVQRQDHAHLRRQTQPQHINQHVRRHHSPIERRSFQRNHQDEAVDAAVRPREQHRARESSHKEQKRMFQARKGLREHDISAAESVQINEGAHGSSSSRQRGYDQEREPGKPQMKASPSLNPKHRDYEEKPGQLVVPVYPFPSQIAWTQQTNRTKYDHVHESGESTYKYGSKDEHRPRETDDVQDPVQPIRGASRSPPQQIPDRHQKLGIPEVRRSLPEQAGLVGESNGVREKGQPQESVNRAKQAREHWKERLKLERQLSRSRSRSQSPPKPRDQLDSRKTFEEEDPDPTMKDDTPPETVTETVPMVNPELQSGVTTLPVAEDTEPNDNQKLLLECYSAIISLKETSESKYQALESKYVELKSSTNPQPDYQSTSRADYESKIETLEFHQRELETVIARLEAKNREVIEESRKEESNHRSVIAQLEAKNGELVEDSRKKASQHRSVIAQLEAKNGELVEDSRTKASQHRSVIAQLEAKNGELVEDSRKKASQHQAAIAQLEAKNAELVEDSRKKASQHQAAIAQLEVKNAELINDSRGKASQHQAAIAQLEASNCELLDENKKKESQHQALEDSHLELETQVRQLEAKNFKLLDDSRKKESQHQALEDSFLELETQNRQLRKAAFETDDTYQKLRDSIERLEERNSQLSLEAQEAERLQAHCQSLEERCAELQSQFSHLEAENFKLRNECTEMESKCKVLEDKREKLEALTDEHESEKHNALDEKDNFQDKCKALETICQKLEESNSQLEAQILQAKKERDDFQSKAQSLQAQALILEVSTMELKTQSQLLQDERDTCRSQLYTAESNCTELEGSKEGFQTALQETRETCQALEESNREIARENQSLRDEKESFRSRLQELETKFREVKGFQEKLQEQNYQLEDGNQKLSIELQVVQSTMNVLEKAKNDLTEENAKLEDSNAKLRAMQKGLKDTMEEAKKEVQRMCSFAAQSRTQAVPVPTETSEVTEEMQQGIGNGFLACSSTDSSDDIHGDVEGASRLGYEVISSQEIQSFNIRFNPPERDDIIDADEGGVVGRGRDADNGRTLEDELQEKLNQLGGSSESSDGEDQYYESLDMGPPALRRPRTTSGETRKQLVKDKRTTSVTKQSLSWSGTSPTRSLPPLPPKPLPVPNRPPLPPVTRLPGKSGDHANARQYDDLEASSSDYSTGSSSNRYVEIRASQTESPQGDRQSPSSILNELLGDQEDDGQDGEIQNPHQKMLETETDPEQPVISWIDSPCSPRSRAEEDSLSGKNARRSRKATDGRLGKSSSSSPVMANLQESRDEEPMVIPEDTPRDDQPPLASDMVFYMTKSGEIPLMPPLAVKPHRHRHESTSAEEESNSIVTQSSTHTQDLLNTPSRKSRHINRKMEKSTTSKKNAKMGTPASSNDESNQCADCYFPFVFQASQQQAGGKESSQPQNLSVATRPNFRLRCDESGCGIDLGSTCTSMLARRTWDYGKKHSKHHLISNSEQSSVASVRTSPTGSTTVVAGGGNNAVQPEDATSFESNTSDNGTASTGSKPLGSAILAKRDKLRRKQGGFVQTASSSGSSQSEREASKEATKPRQVLFSFLS
ncbi:BRCT domain protein [Seminavis robusta]|uniref:BRCT domain protein n=1 Tax=Seminavis robusta TaxID=568900 RepID=A0A9N8EZU5_9STRA|nr:BRCT domain protein [Seminavis robusta]|eukprot:Sro2138_g316100.1 BRCT domain protein (2028) ;mRNA; r:8517-14600